MPNPHLLIAAKSILQSVGQRAKAHYALPLAIGTVAKRHPFANVEQCLAAFVEANDVPEDEFLASGTTYFEKAVHELIHISRTAGSAWDEATARAIVKDFFEAIDELRLDKISARIDARNAQRFENMATQVAAISEDSQLLRQQQTEILRRLEQGTATRAVVVTAESPTDPSPTDPHAARDARIERRATIKAMLRLGQFASAEREIAAYEHDFPTDAEDLYEATTWRLICATELGRHTEALAHAESAIKQRPKDATALSNAAAVALACGLSEQALAYATEMRRADPAFTIANLIYALDAAGKEEALDVTLATVEHENATHEVQQAIAVVLFRRGEYARAEHLLRLALLTASNDSDLKEMLALTLAARGDFTRLSSTSTRLAEAESLLTQAIELRRTWQARQDARRYFVNRAVIRALRRDYDGAIADCDIVLSEEPTHEAAVTTKAHALADRGDTVEAWRVISALQGHTTEIALQRGRILVQLGRATEAVRELTPLLHEVDQHVSLGAAELLVQVAAQTVDAQLLEQVLAAISSDNERCVLRGYWHLRCGETVQAIQSLERVVTVDSETIECSAAAINLAGAYIRAGRLEDAIRIFDQALSDESDPKLLARFAEVLCRASSYDRARAIALSLLEFPPEATTARELLASIAEQTGDVATAAAQFAELADITASDEHRLRAANDYWRAQQPDQVVALLDMLPEMAFADDPELLVQFAELEAAVGRDGSDRAYRAMWLSRSAEAEEAFVRLWHASPDRSRVFDVVKEGSAVELQEHDRRVMVVVTDSRHDTGLPDHHSTTSDIGMALMGKKLGDELSLSGRILTIGSIIYKKERAFALALSESARHLDNARVREFDPHLASDVERKRLEHLIGERQKWLQRYLAGEVSLGRAATESDDTVVHWWSYVAQPTGGLNAGSFGDDDVAKLTQRELVIELTAALTLAYLGLTDAVLNSGVKFLSTQTAVDLLLMTERRELFSDSPPHSAIVIDGVIQARPVDKHAYVRFGRIVRDACRILGAARIMPVADGSNSGAVDRAKLVADVGRIAADSLVVTARADGTWLVDDAHARIVAENLSVRTAPTQALLMSLRAQQCISEEEYRRSIIQLSRIGYSFLRVSVNDVYAAWTDAGAIVTDDVSRLVAELASPFCTIESTINVASGILMSVWKSEYPRDRADALVSAVLTATAIGRDITVLHRLVGRCIERGPGVYGASCGERFARGLSGVQQWVARLNAAVRSNVRHERRKRQTSRSARAGVAS